MSNVIPGSRPGPRFGMDGGYRVSGFGLLATGAVIVGEAALAYITGGASLLAKAAEAAFWSTTISTGLGLVADRNRSPGNVGGRMWAIGAAVSTLAGICFASPQAELQIGPETIDAGFTPPLWGDIAAVAGGATVGAALPPMAMIDPRKS